MYRLLFGFLNHVLVTISPFLSQKSMWLILINKYIEMHGQQNIKTIYSLRFSLSPPNTKFWVIACSLALKRGDRMTDAVALCCMPAQQSFPRCMDDKCYKVPNPSLFFHRPNFITNFQRFEIFVLQRCYTWYVGLLPISG